MIKVYQKGELVRVDVLVKNIGGTLIDPDTLELRFTKPSGASVVRHWPTPAEITKDGTGTFHIDESATEVGRWFYSAVTTGNGQAAENGEFAVEATQ